MANGNSRAPWHNYRSRAIYMITLLKSPGVPEFAFLPKDFRLSSDKPEDTSLIRTPLGKTIASNLHMLSENFPHIRLLQYCIMPDHVHLLLFVEKPLPEPLGFEIARFKVALNKAAGIKGLFADGFNDQILKPSRKLDTLFQYIRANPYRLAVRRAHPDFFTRCNELVIADIPCRAYGNMQLLDNPFKEQVIVHRADTAEQFSANKDLWLHTAANGGVLVSPFISPREKEIRTESEALGGRIILISNKPFGDREKPASHDFDLCAQGRLLIISPADPLEFSRTTCLALNQLAERIMDVG